MVSFCLPKNKLNVLFFIINISYDSYCLIINLKSAMSLNTLRKLVLHNR